jgi:hypothetical protein
MYFAAEMHSIITSYLLQSKECILPGIGVLQIIHTPASTDAANNRILPPVDEIIFKKEDHSASGGLVDYISKIKKVDKAEAETLLNNFCKEWKEKINAGERLTFEAIGSIYKRDGEIILEKESNINFLKPIAVDSVYRKVQESVSVEEKHISIKEEPVMAEAYEYREEQQEVVVERSYWGLWALIFFAIAAVVLFYHFKDHTLSGSSVGNQNHLAVDSANATYRSSR